jgi:hypothetical protein
MDQMFLLFSSLGEMGRLGNQLFQIATAYTFAKDNGLTLLLPHWKYDSYLIQPVSKDPTHAKNALIHPRPEHWVFREEGFKYRKFMLHDFVGKLNPIENHHGLPYYNMFGYFQSEKYFAHRAEEIRTLFSLNNESWGSIYKELQSKPTIGKLCHVNYSKTAHIQYCAIHVRRGDYVDNPFYTNLGVDYYLSAIKIMEERSMRSHYTVRYIVFTDDIEYCQRFFQRPEFEPYFDNITILVGFDDFESLKIMSWCHHYIIANSSYSWWGAWLCHSKNKHIVFPQKWFGEASHIKDWSDIYFNESSRSIIP